jgi:hypothetical protein
MLSLALIVVGGIYLSSHIPSTWRWRPRSSGSAARAVVLTRSSVVVAVHVPTLIGFTVARFWDADARPAAQD